MSRYIAWQISDDFESMMDEGEFDCPATANEHLLDIVQGQSISHVSNGVMDTYRFRDNSSISFKGNNYRVEVNPFDKCLLLMRCEHEHNTLL